LVHGAKRDFARYDRGDEYNVGKDIVGLQVQNPADVEIHIVEIYAEIIATNGCIKLDQCGRRGAIRIILAKDEFLPVKWTPYLGPGGAEVKV
jgi:hypothetical protein